MPRLGELCDILNGYAFKSAKYVPDGVRIIRISNVQKGRIEDTAPVFYPHDSAEVARHALRSGDVLVSLTGNVGRAAMVDAAVLPAALNQRVACLRVKSGVPLDGTYLFECLDNARFERLCVQAARGEAQKNLSTDWLKQQSIPLPDLQEQRRIADTAARIRELSRSVAAQLHSLYRLETARFAEMFGPYGEWARQTCIGEMADVSSGFAFRSSDLGEVGVPVVRIADIADGRVSLAGAARCAERFWADMPRFRLCDGDILLAMSGSTGKAGVFRGTQPALLNQRVACIRPRDPQSGAFLLAALRSDWMQAYIRRESAGCAQQNISVRQVVALPVPAATAHQLATFAALIQKTDAMRAELRKTQADLEQLRESLLDEIYPAWITDPQSAFR